MGFDQEESQAPTAHQSIPAATATGAIASALVQHVGRLAPDAIAHLIVKHPLQRDAILRELHRTRGIAAVHHVISLAQSLDPVQAEHASIDASCDAVRSMLQALAGELEAADKVATKARAPQQTEASNEPLLQKLRESCPSLARQTQHLVKVAPKIALDAQAIELLRGDVGTVKHDLDMLQGKIGMLGDPGLEQAASAIETELQALYPIWRLDAAKLTTSDSAAQKPGIEYELIDRHLEAAAAAARAARAGNPDLARLCVHVDEAYRALVANPTERRAHRRTIEDVLPDLQGVEAGERYGNQVRAIGEMRR